MGSCRLAMGEAPRTAEQVAAWFVTIYLIEIIQIATMATSTYFEIESFISKFTSLTSYGHTADLRFTSLNGNISVDFKASLGIVNPVQESYQHVKPSRVRRRQRRKENRDKLCKSTSTETSNTDFTSDQIRPVVFDDQNLLPIQQDAEDVNDIAVDTSTFCDAAVQTDIVAIQDSLCQTDLNLLETCISQTKADDGLESDLNLYYDEDGIPRNPSLAASLMASTTTSSEDQCDYCNEILYNWDEFLQRLKRYPFMCNGCLDFFDAKPWFTLSELSVIEELGNGWVLHHSPMYSRT